MSYIHSKAGSSKAARMGKWIECRFCLKQHRGEIHKVELIPNDGRGALVCDDHMHLYIAEQRAKGLEPNYTMPEFFSSEEQAIKDNVKLKVELRMKLNANEGKLGRDLNAHFE